jgi:hypothetical protein
MQFGVPYDLDITDVEASAKAWQIVYSIVSWMSVEEIETHQDENGEEHQHLKDLWFPAVLRPSDNSAGVGPGLTWYGQMHVFETRRDAMMFARSELKRLRKDRADLEKALTDLTVDAAMSARLEKDV